VRIERGREGFAARRARADVGEQGSCPLGNDLGRRGERARQRKSRAEQRGQRSRELEDIATRGPGRRSAARAGARDALDVEHEQPPRLEQVRETARTLGLGDAATPPSLPVDDTVRE